MPGFTGSAGTPGSSIFTVTSGAAVPTDGILRNAANAPIDFAFVVWVDGEATTVTLSTATQGSNTSGADLIADLNDALSDAGLTDLEAELVGGHLQFKSDDAFALTVAAVPGFAEDQAEHPRLQHYAHADGTSFNVDLAGADDAGDDGVVRLIDQAAASGNGAGGVVTASLDGTRLKIVDSATTGGNLTVLALDQFTAGGRSRAGCSGGWLDGDGRTNSGGEAEHRSAH